MAMQAGSIDWPAPAIPKLQGQRVDVNLTNNEITWMVSLLHLGNLFSPIPTSYLMDRFGRKNTLLYTTVFNIISWIIIYFATSPYQFYVARFLCGLVNGVISIIAPIYIGEISEKDNRGSVSNIINILMNFTSVYICSIGMYVSYEGLVIATSLISIAFILTFMWMPETPYFYLIRNDCDKALKSLTWLRSDKSIDAIISELKFMDSNVKKQMQTKSTYLQVISSRANRKALFTVLLIAALQRFTGYGSILTYSSVILPKNSFSFLSLEQCVILMSISRFVSPILISFFIDKYNRRSLLFFSCFGCGLLNLVVAVWFIMNQNTKLGNLDDKYTWIPVVSFLCHAGFFAAGLGPVGTVFRGELFAATIKGKSSALLSIFNTILAFFIGKFFLIFSDAHGMYFNFVIYSTTCFAGLIVVYLYVIETKGKTLEQIQDEMDDERETIKSWKLSKRFFRRSSYMVL